eukprot:GFUD01020598.1.p1 GENE.GFUD01020598.1~~GFUD01020598.1.p1  ORF type:complete len:520 (+),score=166.60 GFUD01020598.1:49-1608(+)
MADPLSLLRQFNMQRKTIVERDGHVIFGEFSWPKTVNTNYVEWGTGKDGTAKDYYTLECLLYLLKNITLQHPVYVRQAAGEDIPIVRRPDRKDLLAYLKGESTTAASIDKSAPLEMPTQVKRTAEDSLESAQKKPRYDEGASQKLKDQLIMKYGDNQEAGAQGTGANIKDLSAELNKNKISEIKKKIWANRRTRIKGDGEEGDRGLASFADLESDRTKEILSRERQWRTRTTILQSNGKQFAKNILAILNSVKAREEGRQFKPAAPPGSAGARPGMPPAPRQPLPGYNRYVQEHYRQADTEGFKIDTTGTYAGKTLKSVMAAEGGKARSAPAMPPPAVPRPIGQPQQQQKGGKRVSRTPIIIIPAAPKSLITMFNAKDILQDLKYVSTEEKRAAGAKRENDVLIQRRKEGALTVPYRVLDNPGRLNNAEWDRVVGVFVMGQAWQFKGWPNEGKPVDILSRICGFHLKQQEATLEKNIANWAVTVIQLSRTKRHLDRAALLTFWEKLDKHIVKHKPHLRW